MADMCSIDFTTVYMLAAYASVITAAVIGISYMVGNFTKNPKVSVWAKTEAIQLVVSVISVIILVFIMNAFCLINMNALSELFGFTYTGSSSASIYGGAEHYLEGAAKFSHNSLTVTRYHLKGFTVLAYIGMFECDGVGSAAALAFPFLSGCMYGYSGENIAPFGGYGAVNGMLTAMFNANIMSYIMSLNYLFILRYVYYGFVLFLLPIGIFARSLPYLRGFGSVFIAMAISFMLVYPLILAVFDLMGAVLINSPNFMYYDPGTDLRPYLDESVYPETSSGASFAMMFDREYLRDKYDLEVSNLKYIAMFSAHSFIAGVFLPSVALLGTIASAVYISRLYGEEIDLSRIMQMV